MRRAIGVSVRTVLVLAHLHGPLSSILYVLLLLGFVSIGAWGISILPATHAAKKRVTTKDKLLPSALAFSNACRVKVGGKLSVVCTDFSIAYL